MSKETVQEVNRPDLLNFLLNFADEAKSKQKEERQESWIKSTQTEEQSPETLMVNFSAIQTEKTALNAKQEELAYEKDSIDEELRELAHQKDIVIREMRSTAARLKHLDKAQGDAIRFGEKYNAFTEPSTRFWTKGLRAVVWITVIFAIAAIAVLVKRLF